MCKWCINYSALGVGIKFGHEKFPIPHEKTSRNIKSTHLILLIFIGLLGQQSDRDTCTTNEKSISRDLYLVRIGCYTILSSEIN